MRPWERSFGSGRITSYRPVPIHEDPWEALTEVSDVVNTWSGKQHGSGLTRNGARARGHRHNRRAVKQALGVVLRCNDIPHSVCEHKSQLSVKQKQRRYNRTATVMTVITAVSAQVEAIALQRPAEEELLALEVGA